MQPRIREKYAIYLELHKARQSKLPPLPIELIDEWMQAYHRYIRENEERHDDTQARMGQTQEELGRTLG